jgi:hypothetical protein
MAKITEDFVSFETAKLLKEKNCPDFGYSCICDSEGNKAQTQSIIMKWLKEVYMLHIWIGHNNKKGLPWYYEIHNIKTGMVVKIGGVDYGSYETAAEAAIKYSLEHLI